MKQVAIYGKGGIGKSTIAANLSAALALCGQKVLQVGCDPKHDSTRLLLGGKVITTVLDYLRATPPGQWNLNDVLFEGYGGVACVESGGPEPGVGCAGRGILSTFDLLEKLGVKSLKFDVAVYDVLGDVVCAAGSPFLSGRSTPMSFILLLPGSLCRSMRPTIYFAGLKIMMSRRYA